MLLVLVMLISNLLLLLQLCARGELNPLLLVLGSISARTNLPADQS